MKIKKNYFFYKILLIKKNKKNKILIGDQNET